MGGHNHHHPSVCSNSSIHQQKCPWQPDQDWPSCKRCLAGFSFFRRKHHCRRCGSVVCYKCSPHRAPAAGYKGPERCCNVCHAALAVVKPPPQSESKPISHAPTLSAVKEIGTQGPRIAPASVTTTETALAFGTHGVPSSNALPDSSVSFGDFANKNEPDSDDDSDNDLMSSPISNNNSIALKSNASSTRLGVQVLQVSMQTVNQSVTINVSAYPRETVGDLIDRLADQMWSLTHGVRRSRKFSEFVEFKNTIICTNHLNATLTRDVPLATLAMERHAVIMCANPQVCLSASSLGTPSPTVSSSNFFLRHSFPSAPPEMLEQQTEIFE